MSASSSPSAVRSPLFTLEDAKIAFNIFCCICGIGSLGMPSNYARAGWGYATVALLFMAVSNIYATVLLSKVLMVAPSSVKTYGDLGEWVAGKWGRFFVVVSHMGVCLLAPCAFLVLGGTLLDVLFPDSFSQTVWIIFMAAMVIPVALIPTLKESAGMAVAGCLGTIIADIIGVAILLYEERGHPTPPTPDVTLHQVLTTFGNLSLAYAAAIVIPDLQRQHSQPERMPRVIVVSLGLASAFFLAIAIIGYVAGGCQLSGNLLFSIVNTSDPYSTTTLGFTANRGAVVMSYLFMQLHLSIAFSTILHPAFYMAERLVLGMHKDDTLPTDSEEREIEIEEKMSYLDDLSEYKGSVNVVRYVLVRIALIAILAVASILLKDHFLDLVDFTGATAITVCSLILPLIFYAKVFWRKIPMGEKAICITISTICGIVGCYVMIYAGKKLFNPDDDGATFPYCSTEYQDEPYYIRNSTVSN
ncbi:Amino Acid/Auxin Permease (AAAP) Family [Phytophthora infestans T30-4]|uniref:Amino Acid/Auxin Permease (AAAP) Family n=1 Tax=Phytophthora infestans (strain T30-4) TaxID=403677 RepID=D0NW77_PHYIT|nr:Amino Acid/Auxin Permease (AAAP) Family [Phytophthora infestans T30-4]EEY66894.1 Amino Acid/Auxin Permease (AAAP) Family [Phytophthora infestans T30-4]|eukprot:XP_002896612.1 Amino Acid/Auxin Permease (AAAP) Family [Phytophthora infestans T30-4]